MDERQMELLKKVDNLPENPCDSCGEIMCEGVCGKKTDFDEVWKPYKEAGIFIEATKIREAHEITARMREIVGELSGKFSEEEMKALRIPNVSKQGRQAAMPSKEETVCFTGRRPKDLWGYEPKNDEYEVLTGIVEKKVEELAAKGYRRFITGGAQGFDQVAFDAVDTVRRMHPELGIQNVLYAPCKGQDAKWAEKGRFSKTAYKNMLNFATYVRYVHDRPYESPKDLMDRNHAMVEDASLCVALWPESENFRTTMKSGTAECMRYAKKQGLKLEIIDPAEVERALEQKDDEMGR